MYVHTHTHTYTYIYIYTVTAYLPPLDDSEFDQREVHGQVGVGGSL